MSVVVDGQFFEGSGRNKKLAKARAAQSALATIFNLHLDQTPSRQPVLSEGLQLHLPQVRRAVCFKAWTLPLGNPFKHPLLFMSALDSPYVTETSAGTLTGQSSFREAFP
jgi:hypothetical protein